MIDTNLPALRIEGNFFPANLLDKVAAFKAEFQGPTDYGLHKKLSPRDEAAHHWNAAKAWWEDLHDARRQGLPMQEPTLRWLNFLMVQVLGLSDLKVSEPHSFGERSFPISHQAVDGRLAFVLVAADRDLDTVDGVYGSGRRTATVLLQTFLNASSQHLWGIASNGRQLRLLRDNPSLVRQAYLEVDLDRIFAENRLEDFKLLFYLLHLSRFRPPLRGGEDCVLELWHRQARSDGERALQALRDGVAHALVALGSGFLNPAHGNLLADLRQQRLSVEAYREQLLRLVYRLIFLITCEERDLLFGAEASPEQRRIYREAFAVTRLRQRSLEERGESRHHDLWLGLRSLFELLRRGELTLALPALGGLFASDQCRELELSLIDNRSLLEAMRQLCFFHHQRDRVRVNYRDMGSEELGGIYESLLELVPRIDFERGRFHFAGFDGEAGLAGHQRKLTGSYYTPAELVERLVDQVLEPVMAETLQRHQADPDAALLRIKVIDPACGSGHFLLSAARRLASRLARLRHGTDQATEVQFRHGLRDVVRHCIYGVDLNPLAVELCRLSLWLESMEPGRPLSFLDHRIRHGNALVGLLKPEQIGERIPEEAYKPLGGDDKLVAKSLKKRNSQPAQSSLSFGDAQQPLAGSWVHNLDAMDEDDLQAVEAKRAQWLADRNRPEHLKQQLLADLYTAAFFAPKTQATAELVPTGVELSELRHGQLPPAAMHAYVSELAQHHHFFHWYLEFPEVHNNGGFDCVLGNPPWERLQFEEQEFFAQHDASIVAAANAAARKKKIAALETSQPEVFAAYLKSKHMIDAAGIFMRFGGRFPLTAHGELNLYPVFAEHALSLLNARGYAGIIVPTGIATDDSTSLFFGSICDNKRLLSLFDFENRKNIFPAVDSRMKFCLLAMGNGIEYPLFSFFNQAIGDLSDPRRTFKISVDDIGLFNPNSKNCPIFRTEEDARLTKKLYQAGDILLRDGVPREKTAWQLELCRFLNMADDSHLFLTYADLEQKKAEFKPPNWIFENKTYVPLYEGKMIHHYDHRFQGFEKDGRSTLSPDPGMKTPDFFSAPRYWVAEDQIPPFLVRRKWTRNWFLGWRDICRATDERTAILSLFPLACAGDNLPIIFPNLPTILMPCLISQLSSIVFDFVARQKVGGTHLNYFILKQLPVLPPEAFNEEVQAFIRERVLNLVYTSHDMEPFARDLGYEGGPFPFNEALRYEMRAELDACIAQLFGLSYDELDYILDPSIKGVDFPSETFRVLKDNEIKRFGHYRTRDQVLRAYKSLNFHR